MLIIDILVKKFDEYYYKYLGCNGKDTCICPKNTNFTVNSFNYPIIISCYEDNLICSVSDRYYESVKINLGKYKTIFEMEEYITDFFRLSDNIVIQKMRRMSKIKESNISISNVVDINEIHKSFFFNSFIHNNDEAYKQLKWEKLLKNKYINGVIKDNKIVSLGFVSNIDHGGANIVIQTIDGYKNNGYGKCIVEKLSRDILRDGLLPIYWVNENNIYSIKLAESIGFETKSKEIVVKYK